MNSATSHWRIEAKAAAERGAKRGSGPLGWMCLLAAVAGAFIAAMAWAPVGAM